MDVREKVNDLLKDPEALKALQESSKRYVELYADPQKVTVNVWNRRGSLERFMIYPTKKFFPMSCHFPFYLTLGELQKIDSDGKGEVYGRTEDGPFCELRVEHFRVRQVRVLPRDRQDEIKRILYEE